MTATTDRPTAIELDQLAGLLAATPLNRGALAAALRQIEQGLREHGHDLDRSDGLLDEDAKAHRMSLAREDDRLREEGVALLGEVVAFRQAAGAPTTEEDLHQRGSALLAGLRGHHDAEASLLIESFETEVGSGD